MHTLMVDNKMGKMRWAAAAVLLLFFIQPAQAECKYFKGADGFPLGIVPNVTRIDATFEKPETINYTFDLYIEAEFGTSISQDCEVEIAVLSNSPALGINLSLYKLETGAGFNKKPIVVFLTPLDTTDFPDIASGSIKISDVDQRFNFAVVPITVLFKFPRPPRPSPSPVVVINYTNDTEYFNFSEFDMNFSDDLNETIDVLNESGVDIQKEMGAIEAANALKNEGRLDSAKRLLSGAYASVKSKLNELKFAKWLFSWWVAAGIIAIIAAGALFHVYELKKKQQEETSGEDGQKPPSEESPPVSSELSQLYSATDDRQATMGAGPKDGG